jgi:hypothetical protein
MGTKQVPSNVVRIVRALKHFDDAGIAQIAYYQRGVGTDSDLEDKVVAASQEMMSLSTFEKPMVFSPTTSTPRLKRNWNLGQDQSTRLSFSDSPAEPSLLELLQV